VRNLPPPASASFSASASFEVGEPELQLVASWVARGLTAYDAAYVALAEERDLVLVTDDEAIMEIANEIGRPLVEGRI